MSSKNTTDCSKINAYINHNNYQKGIFIRSGMKEIGHKIRELRKEMDCTQNKLADILGVTQDSISLWENDKRIPDTQYIVAMAKFFDVTADYLLGLSDDFTGVKFGHEGKEKEWLTSEEKQVLSAYRSLSVEKKKEINKNIVK